MNKSLIVWLGIVLLPVGISGQTSTIEPMATTAAGEIRLWQQGLTQWQVRLNQRTLLSGAGVAPRILTQIKSGVAPYAEVVILQRVEGSYCNSGRFWFLGLRPDGHYQLSRGIGACFAHEPMVTVQDNYVTLTIQGGYGNHHLPGEKYLPGGTWRFQNGKAVPRKMRRK